MNITASLPPRPAQVRSCATCGGHSKPAAEAAPADHVQLSGAPAATLTGSAAATGMASALMAAAPPPGGHMGVHGMLLFGNNLMSHIPMFHVPHDYQIIMDVELKHPELPAGQNYGDKLHTFVPEKFSLGDLLNGKLTSFSGTLFEGNFEAEGSKQLLENVTAEVKAVLRSEHLDQHSAGPQQLEYIAYGTPDDAYLLHPIHGDADFDQLLGVKLEGSSLKAEELAKGLRVTVPDHRNKVDDRLQPGQSVAARTADGTLSLTVDRELSILVGPGFTGPPGQGGGGHHGH